MLININIHWPKLHEVYRNQQGHLVLGFNDSDRYKGLVTMFVKDEQFDDIVNAVNTFRKEETK